MAVKRGSSYRMAALPVTIVAHLLAAATITLVLVWVLRFRRGLSLKSNHVDQIISAHAVFMLVGLVVCGGEAMLVYKTFPGTRKVKELFHMLLHLVALTLGGLGLFATFKFHNSDLGLKDLHSLHSWLGIGTICLYALQWLLGLAYFLFPGTTMTKRANYAPWHAFLGAVIFLMAVCSAETGLNKFLFDGPKLGSQGLVVNFIGLVILLFAVAVVLGVILP